MRKFHETSVDTQLFDLGYRGTQYTFSNSRLGDNETRARLDRVLSCGDWLKRFPKAQVRHISTVTSDQMLLLIDFSVTQTHRSNKSFHFEPMWLRCNDFNDKVQRFWSVASIKSQSLKSKLEVCASQMHDWNKLNFGPVKAKVSKLRNELEKVWQKVRTNATAVEE